MSDENWENQEVAMLPPSGRIFGMHSRGFRCFERESSQRSVIIWSRKNDSNDSRPGSCKNQNKYGETVKDDNENGAYDDLDQETEETSFKNDNYKSNKKKSSLSKNETSRKEKKQTYIPPEIEDAEELFSSGITSGINFDKYDEIEVKVTGENIPAKIDDFEDAGLHPILLSNIRRSSYKKPTPIQKHALPIIMARRDMMACAQTGSGKTCAFLIPIIHNLMLNEPHETRKDKMAMPQVLVITPTRELAKQIHTEARKFSYGSSLTSEVVYGATDFRQQAHKVEQGCNILVVTTGRLLHFMDLRKISLESIRCIVLDEADRLLDASFLPQIDKILTKLTNMKSVQILMFSATFQNEVQRLATKFLKNYLFLTVGIVGGACSDVLQKFLLVQKAKKRQELVKLLRQLGSSKTLVFVGKKRTADIIATYLSEMDFPATSMHGDREQKLREEALNDFKSGRKDLLVATAVAARGLDINNVAHVINFDLPSSVDEYVHRIGRTGRVGNKGLATSFFDPSIDFALAPDIIRILAQAQQEVPDFLQEYAHGSYYTGKSWSIFGGRDIRKNRGPRSDEVPTTRSQPVTSFVEEEW